MKPSLTEKLLSPSWLFVEGCILQAVMQFYLYHRFVIEGNAEMIIPPYFCGLLTSAFSITPTLLFLIDCEKEQKNKKSSALFQLVMVTAVILFCIWMPFLSWFLNTH